MRRCRARAEPETYRVPRPKSSYRTVGCGAAAVMLNHSNELPQGSTTQTNGPRFNHPNEATRGCGRAWPGAPSGGGLLDHLQQVACFGLVFRIQPVQQLELLLLELLIGYV